jgi:flagellar basal body-associated protein FliL
MKKIDLVKKLASAAGVKEELQIQFFEFLVSKLYDKLAAGDSIKIPEIGELFIKRGAIKNEEMDDIDFDNPLDILAYPVASGDNVIFMVPQISKAQINAVTDIFSDKGNPNPIFNIEGTESMDELLEKVISGSRYHKNLIVGQEYLVIGYKELQVLDAGYFDEIFSTTKEQPKFDDFHESLDDALEHEPVVEKEINPVIEETEVADRILDEFDYDFNAADFEKVDPFNNAVNNIFPVESEPEEEIQIDESKYKNKDTDEFVRITDKPNFTDEITRESEPEVETLESLEVLEEPEIEEPEVEPSPYEEENENKEADEKEYVEPDDEFEERPKRKKKNLVFIMIAGFLVVLLVGLLLFYKFGGRLFSQKNETAPVQKSVTTTVERKYDIPVTYSDDKKSPVDNKTSVQNTENAVKPEEKTPQVTKPVQTAEKKQEKSPVKTLQETPVKKEQVKKEIPKKEINKQVPVSKEKVVNNKPKQTAKKEVTKEAPKTMGGITKQVSSWRTREQAEAQVRKYKSRGYNAFIKEVDLSEKGTWYRVMVSFKTVQQSNSFKE